MIISHLLFTAPVGAIPVTPDSAPSNSHYILPRVTVPPSLETDTAIESTSGVTRVLGDPVSLPTSLTDGLTVDIQSTTAAPSTIAPSSAIAGVNGADTNTILNPSGVSESVSSTAITNQGDNDTVRFPQPSASSLPGAECAGTTKDHLGCLLASASSGCIADGGGCAVLGRLSPFATDDTQACKDFVTLAAQVCGQCIGDQPAFDLYNTYLGMCDTGVPATVDGGPPSNVEESTIPNHLTPTATSATLVGDVTLTDVSSSDTTSTDQTSIVITVPKVQPTSEGAMTSTLILNVTATETPVDEPVETSAVVGGNDDGAQTIVPTTAGQYTTLNDAGDGSDLPGPAETSTEIHTVSETIAQDTGTGRTGNQQAAPTMALVALETGLVIQTSVSVVDTTVGNSTAITPSRTAPQAVRTDMANATLTAGLMTGIDNGDDIALPGAAFNATEAFFEHEIDESCAQDCRVWVDQYKQCKQPGQRTPDACLCSADTMVTAGRCSSCMGAAGRSVAETYRAQMNAYSAFRGNCSLVSSSPPSSTQRLVSLAAAKDTAVGNWGPGAVETVARANPTAPSGYYLDRPNTSGQSTIVASEQDEVVVQVQGAKGHAEGPAGVIGQGGQMLLRSNAGRLQRMAGSTLALIVLTGLWMLWWDGNSLN